MPASSSPGLDPDRVAEFLSIYYHSGSLQKIHDLCKGKEAFKELTGEI